VWWSSAANCSPSRISRKRGEPAHGLKQKRRESDIRSPALSLMLTFYPAGPYLAGLNLRVALALASMAVPAVTLHLLVEPISVNGTVK